MSISLLHDPFCRDILSDVSTFLEFVEYLTSRDEDLKTVVDLLDRESFMEISDDLVFLAKVKKELQSTKKESERLGVVFLLEHKSCRDDKAIEQILRYQHHLVEENRMIGIKTVLLSRPLSRYCLKMSRWIKSLAIQACPKNESVRC